MAITTATQTLLDGPRKLVQKFTAIATGGTGESSTTVKVDVSALDPVPTEVRIDRIHYHAENLNVTMRWADTTAPAVIHTFNAGSAVTEGEFDYRSFGGLYNNAPAPTGDVTFETVVASGGTTGTGAYTFVLEMTKKF